MSHGKFVLLTISNLMTQNFFKYSEIRCAVKTMHFLKNRDTSKQQ